MPIESANAIKTLTELCQTGSEKSLSKGYGWLNQQLSPALQLVSENHPNKEDLLAESWLITGEIHELLLAPRQAITCYQLALHFQPYSADIHHWLAMVLEQTGQYREAFEHIEKALQLTNDGLELMKDRQLIQDSLMYNKTPTFEIGNPLWEANELLAAGKFAEVIHLIKPLPNNNSDLLRVIYRAYAAIGDIQQATSTWEQVLTIEPDAEKDEVDLFYES